MHDEFQIRVYPRGGRGKNARCEWVVYDLDGITPLVSGETFGADKHAKAAANQAATQLYLDRKSKKTK